MSTSSPLVYTHMYRWHGEYYGRRCAIVKLSQCGRDRNGVPIHNTGHESIAIEFEDGTRIEAQRQQVMWLGSKQAKQVEAKAKRMHERTTP